MNFTEDYFIKKMNNLIEKYITKLKSKDNLKEKIFSSFSTCFLNYPFPL